MFMLKNSNKYRKLSNFPGQEIPGNATFIDERICKKLTIIFAEVALVNAPIPDPDEDVCVDKKSSV